MPRRRAACRGASRWLHLLQRMRTAARRCTDRKGICCLAARIVGLITIRIVTRSSGHGPVPFAAHSTGFHLSQLPDIPSRIRARKFCRHSSTLNCLVMAFLALISLIFFSILQVYFVNFGAADNILVLYNALPWFSFSGCWDMWCCNSFTLLIVI